MFKVLIKNTGKSLIEIEKPVTRELLRIQPGKSLELTVNDKESAIYLTSAFKSLGLKGSYIDLSSKKKEIKEVVTKTTEPEPEKAPVEEVVTEPEPEKVVEPEETATSDEKTELKEVVKKPATKRKKLTL